MLTVRQRFHLWCFRGKIIWHFAAVWVQFFPKPLEILGVENYSTDKFYPGEPSKNLHCEQNTYILFLLLSALLQRHLLYLVLALNWFNDALADVQIGEFFHENGFFINFYACAVCSSYCIFYSLSEVVLS